MTPHQKLTIEYSRILGEFKGTLEGITYNDIPQDLKERLYTKIEQLEAIKVEMPVPEKCKYVRRDGESCTANNECTYPNCLE